MSEGRILAIGHAHEASGFGRVMRGILGQISARYDAHQLCLFAVPGRETQDWTRHYCKDQNDTYGLDELRRLVREVRPDVILIVQDIWIVPGYLEVLEDLQASCKTVAYCPLDGALSKPDVVYPLRTLDCLVTYVPWAKDEIATAFRQLSKYGESRWPELCVVPHGIDTSRFYPLGGTGDAAGRRMGRSLARRRLFGVENELEDAIIILNANQNQPRKRLDLTIEGFAAFARNKPDNVKLYLHTAAVGACRDVRAEAVRCGIGDRLIMTTGDNGRHPAIPDETLNLIYNACDFGVNTSSGEGWGLVSFEHGATGAAQVVPEHSACAGLWKGAAVLVEAFPVRHLTRMPLRMSEVCAADVARAFELLYTDRELLERMGRAAQANARKEDLSWETVGAQWNSVFDRMLQ